ncbi:hypothetical protein [Psychroserpens sp. MEBiC05023]
MKTIAYFIFLLSSYTCFSQNETKPVYYYDVDGREISKEAYSKKSSRYNSLEERCLSLVFDKDTAYIGILKKRKNLGKLTSTQLTALFYNINNNNTPIEKYSIIQYHPGRDKCNNGRFRSNGFENNIYDKRYLKKLKTHFNHKVFWIHKKDNSIKFNRVKYIDWQEDYNQYIEHLFFEYHYLCNSFVIIDNTTGNFISILGESGGNTVTEIAQEISKL